MLTYRLSTYSFLATSCRTTHWESNPDFQPAELAPSHLAMSPLCQWSVGESNPDCLGASQASSLWTNAPFFVFKRSVRELNPVLVLTTDACGRNTYRPSSDPGWNRTIYLLGVIQAS